MEILNEAKLLWKYLKKYKREVQRLTVFAMLASVLSALVPFIYGRLIDVISLKPQSFSFVLALLGVWTLASVSSAFISRTVGFRGSVIGIKASNDLTCKAASHIINLPLSFQIEKKTGEIFARIQRADRYLFQIIDDIVFWFLPHLASILFGIVILFFVEWRLAIGIVFMVLGYFAITIYKTKPLVEKQSELNKAYEFAFGNLYDALSNVRVIKSCAAEGFQTVKTERDFKKKLAKVFKNFVGLWYSLHLWQDIFYALAFVVVFGGAILLLSRGVISSGKLIMSLGYLGLVRLPLKAFGFHWKAFRTGITTIKRLEEVLSSDTEDFNEKGKIIKSPRGEIEFRNVSFSYKKGKPVLKNISFVAPAGKKIALVGGSGEGKTTLVDLISLYFKPNKGKILLDGIDIKDLNLQFLRKIIAYVPQEISLFNDTVKNNIRYGKPDATDQEIIWAAKAANAHQFIESFPQKYDTLVGERGIKLSTGQKQRIAIARALIRDPKILILDEATSSLDAESERLVQEALDRLIKGRTTFIVAHRLSTIKNADKILVLQKGKIVEQGTHSQLIKKKGAYWKFYSLQFKIKK